jgi:hypothetical protein
VAVVDIAQVVDVFNSTIAFVKSLGGIQLNHVVCGLPVEIHFWMMVDRIDDGHFESVFAAFFKFRKSNVERGVGLLNFSVLAKPPKIEKFVFSFLI